MTEIPDELTMLLLSTGMQLPVAADVEDVRVRVEGLDPESQPDQDEFVEFDGINGVPIRIRRRFVEMYSPAEVRRESSLATPQRGLYVPG